MSLFIVDSEMCKRDGRCADVCPMRAIELPSGGREPRVSKSVPNVEERCLECGHCVSVCPTGAFIHRSFSIDTCRPLDRQLLIDPDRVEHFLRSRRSIRKYSTKPVEREVLTELIGLARYAPSGHNRQPVEWLVIYDTDEVHRLTGLVMEWMQHMIATAPKIAAELLLDMVVKAWDEGVDRICHGAPHLIVTHAHRDDRVAQVACTISLAYLDLAAPSFGLGTCWAGYFNAAALMWEPLNLALELPQDHIPMGSMIIGLPLRKYERMPPRRKPSITWR